VAATAIDPFTGRPTAGSFSVAWMKNTSSIAPSATRFPAIGLYVNAGLDLCRIAELGLTHLSL